MLQENRVIHRKPLDWFKPSSNIRKEFDLEGLKLLASTLKMKQLVPLICRSDGTILDGNRRHGAAALDGKPDHLDVILTDEILTPGNIIEMQLVTLQREGISALDQFNAYMGWKKHNPDTPWKRLAELTGADPATISTVISLGKCIPQIRESAAEGLITVSDWAAMSRGTPEEQLSMLTAKLNGEVKNRDQLRKKRAIKLDVSEEKKVKRLKCIVPGTGLTISFSGGEVTLSAALEAAKIFISEVQDALKRKVNSCRVFEQMCAERGQVEQEQP